MEAYTIKDLNNKDIDAKLKHIKDEFNESLIFLKIATLYTTISGSKENESFSKHFDFDLIFNAIEKKMEGKKVYLTEEEFLNSSPITKPVLSKLIKIHLGRKNDKVSLIKNILHENPYTEGFDEGFIFRVYYNLFRAVYFRKKVHSSAETKNFLNFDENSLLELLFLDSEIEELKSTLHISDKLNGSFVSFTRPFLVRYDEKTLTEVCSEIYESHSKLSEKIYQRAVYFEKKIQEKASNLKIPNEKPNELENLKTLGNLIQKNLNALQMTIYNAIQLLESPSLEDKEKIKESVINNFLQDIRLLKEEYSPHRTEEEVKSDAYFRYLKAFTNSLDFFSSVYKGRTNPLDGSLRKVYGGIGASISKKLDFIVIEAVFSSGPSHKAGLQKGDQIVRIKPHPKAQWVSVKDISLDDAAKNLIGGEVGTEISLEIKRKTEEKPLVFTLKRDNVTPPKKEAPLSIFNVKKNKESVKVGVLTVLSFSKDMSVSVKESLQLAKQKGVQSLILDLTGNPGGIMEEAAAIAGYFIESGLIMATGTFFGVTEFYNDPDSNLLWDGPLAVLIDHNSASASEIVTGALKDYSRALIIGSSHTYGKFSIQDIEPFYTLNIQFSQTPSVPLTPSRGDVAMMMKTTTGFYSTPEGTNFQGKGIPSHIQLKMLSEVRDNHSKNKSIENTSALDTGKHFLKSKEQVNARNLWTPVSQSIIQKIKTSHEQTPELQTEEDKKKFIEALSQKVELLELGQMGYKGVSEEATFHEKPFYKEALMKAFQLHQALIHD